MPLLVALFRIFCYSRTRWWHQLWLCPVVSACDNLNSTSLKTTALCAFILTLPWKQRVYISPSTYHMTKLEEAIIWLAWWGCLQVAALLRYTSAWYLLTCWMVSELCCESNDTWLQYVLCKEWIIRATQGVRAYPWIWTKYLCVCK
jgi:hypothetical protein